MMIQHDSRLVTTAYYAKGFLVTYNIVYGTLRRLIELTFIMILEFGLVIHF